MKLEIQYQRLQTKVAKMEADFREATKEIKRENSLLKKRIRDLTKCLETARNAVEREKQFNKDWKDEKVKLQNKIVNLEQQIANKDAHIVNLKRACKVDDNNIWKLDDYDRVKAQLRDYVKRH